MKFPSSNHRPQKEPIPQSIESNAKILEEIAKKVDWKSFIRIYWISIASILGTVMAFIIGVGLANKLVSML